MFEAGKKYTIQELIDLELPEHSLIKLNGNYVRVIQNNPNRHALQRFLRYHPHTEVEVISLPIGYTQTVETPEWVTDETLCWIPVWVRQGNYITRVRRNDKTSVCTIGQSEGDRDTIFLRIFGVPCPDLPPKWDEAKYGSLEEAREIARALAEFEGES